MKRKRFSAEEQIIEILRLQTARAKPAEFSRTPQLTACGKVGSAPVGHRLTAGKRA